MQLMDTVCGLPLCGARLVTCQVLDGTRHPSSPSAQYPKQVCSRCAFSDPTARRAGLFGEKPRPFAAVFSPFNPESGNFVGSLLDWRPETQVEPGAHCLIGRSR